MNISKILIGIDQSKYADNAAQYGFDLAAKFGAAVGIVNIVEPIPAAISPLTDSAFGVPFEGVADINNIEIMNTQTEAADSLLDRMVKRYQQPGMEISQFTDYGSSADGIINCAATFGASLIVVGTHHRSGFDRLLMGSVAEDVVRHSPVPVVVVPFIEAKEEE